jgi:phage terminase large subunit
LANPLEIEINVPKAFDFLLGDQRNIVVHGGRGSGKSHAVATTMLIKSMERKHLILCVREIQCSIKESVKRLLENKISDFGLDQFFTITRDSIICTLTGSQFIFAGLYQNVNSIKSLEGITLVFCEEAQAISQQSLDLLIPTIRMPGSQIYYVFNASQESDPIYRMFIANDPPPDSVVRKVNYDQNPFFPDPLKVEAEWTKQNDPDKWRHVFGGFPVVHSEAQIFYGRWKVKSFDDPPPDMPIYIGADFGFKDASTIVRCWIQGRNLFIDYEGYQNEIEIDNLPALYDTVPGSRDWRITADSSRPETISYLRNRGFNMESSIKGKGSIVEGIEFMKTFDIIIHSRCSKTIEEFLLYSYKTDKRTGEIMPVIEDKNQHVIDAIRYALEIVRRGGIFIS